MILVVGGTGTLGEEICRRLRARDLAVRALVRHTANPARLEPLRGAGVKLCWGDLKDAGSLREACHGAEAVISTASSTLSHQGGDSIETVDRQGQLSLIAAARAAGDKTFYVHQHSAQPGPRVAADTSQGGGGARAGR
jgi:uncharacterized protein YbjT (DUF2867 family)